MTLRVLIAGAGLGGLTLAHGLRNAGLDVAVFERGQRVTDPTAGYRIHIDATGSRALHACLPTDVWNLFTAQSAAPPRGIAFTTEQLEQLMFIAETDPAHDPIGQAHPISRAGLRQLLLTGLDDVVAFDKRLVRYEQSNGQVIAHFADGSTASGDVLVGADGAHSVVRKQLLPDARVVDTGAAGIAGQLYLTERTRSRVPAELLRQMTMVTPAGGLGMFMAPFQRQVGSSPSTALGLPEHLFWTLIGPAQALGLTHETPRGDAANLRQVVLDRVARWHPFLSWLVAESEPSTIVAVPLSTARPVGPWPSTKMTLLGDAIHTMPPLQGLGGNTALRDAAVLCHHLVEVASDRADLIAALHAYEAAMLAYGFDAVRASVQVCDGVATTSRLGRMAFRGVLRVADRVPRLQRLLFARPTVSLPSVAARPAGQSRAA